MDINIKICMIVHQFPPDSGVSAYRMNLRANFLRSQGFQVDVFAPGARDANETLENGVNLHRVKAMMSNGAEDLDYTQNPASNGKSIADNISPLRGFLRWLPPLIKHLRQFNGDDTIIYSYNNPVSLHLAALIVRKKFKSWVCEFRDPIAGYEYSQRGVLGRLTDGWLQNQILKHANVICMRAGIQATPKDYPTAKGKVVQLPDYGIYLDDFAAFGVKTKVNEPIVGVFAGTVFDDISFGPLSNATNTFCNEFKKTRIHTYGPNHKQYLQYENIEYRGSIKFQDLIEVYETSDFMIIFDESNSESSLGSGFIPSKLSELIATCRPILFIGNIKSRTAGIIASLNIGVCVKNNPQSICSALKNIVEGIEKGAFDLKMNSQKLTLIDANASEQSFAEILSSFHEN